MSNTHRLGVQESDGSIRLIASGSFDFCLTKAGEHQDIRPDDILVCEAHETPGIPPDWHEKETDDAETDQ